MSSRGELAWSPPIVAECHRVARSARLRGRFRVRDTHRFVEDLAAAALRVAGNLPQVNAVPAGPSDDVYFATALAGAAPRLVTGDRRHLLPLGRFAGVRILTPAAFLAELASPGGEG